MQRSGLWQTSRALAIPIAAAFIAGACAAPQAAGSSATLPPRPLTLPAGEGMVPEGFTLGRVADVLSPTALAFLPGGEMLITTQPGRLYFFDEEILWPALDLSAVTCTKIEQGLLGVAVDPSFTANRAIYVYYTARSGGGCMNRVSRFTLEGKTASAEQVLIDGIPSPKGNHNAGDLNFGPDGYLYVSTGDGGCDYDAGGCDEDNDASRDRHALVGKILRIGSGGEIPPGNPFAGAGSDRCNAGGVTSPGRTCQETYAEGLRNPYRFAFDPNVPGRLYINDVGQDMWDEIDEGIAGADYGWNLREGRCANGSAFTCPSPPPGLTDPIFDYSNHRKGGCHAITGAAFVPNGVWPEPYAGSYLFGDFGCGAVFRLVEDGAELRAEPFARGFGDFGIVHLEFGPYRESQALYFTTYEDGGAVYRISYEGAR